MTQADRDRFEKCLVLAKRGATPGERAAAKAAAERIATSAGMTLAEATALRRQVRPSTSGPTWPSSWSPPASQPRRRYPRPKPKKPAKPMTVEERLRQKAEIEAERRRASAAADRRLLKELEEQAAYEAQQRVMQAKRDREWAAARARTAL